MPHHETAPLSGVGQVHIHMSVVATSSSLARKEILKFAAVNRSVHAAIQRLLHTAARALSVPAAFSAFFDESGDLKIHTWYGFDATASPQSNFLIADQIRSEEINVIKDATTHPVFSDDIWVTNGGVRFFANVPIKTNSNALIGMFCVLDSEPRTLTNDHHRLLSDFSAMASEAILLRLDTSLNRQTALRARQEKSRFESRFERVVSSLPLPFYAVDEEGTVRSWNRACADTFGYTPREAIGTPLTNLLATEENASKINQLIKSVYNRRRIAGLELDLRTSTGEMRQMHCRLFPFFDEQKNVEACVFVNMELPMARHSRQNLEASKTHYNTIAGEMQQLKSAFLLNMSHELRTPLTSIIGFADILSQQLDHTNGEFVHLIHESAQRLMNTLSAILDLSQLEGHSLDLNPQPLDLAAHTMSIAAPYEKLALEKNLSFKIECEKQQALKACIDPAAQNRIIHNLLTNAIKFTRKGSILISVESDESYCTLKVADTGIGISKEFMPHLFDDFVQEASGIARPYHGSGLGLAITKRLVQLMGGTIEADSKKGQGSTFTIQYPAI